MHSPKNADKSSDCPPCLPGDLSPYWLTLDPREVVTVIIAGQADSITRANLVISGESILAHGRRWRVCRRGVHGHLLARAEGMR